MTNINSLKTRAENLISKYSDFSSSLSFMNPLSKYRLQAEQPKFEMQARAIYREYQTIEASSLSPKERDAYAELESVIQDLLETIFE